MALKKISCEEIIAGAVEYIKNNGLAKLNARSLAVYLKCSTQPIYFQFENMEELKLKALAKAKEHYQQYLMLNMAKEKTLFMACLKGMINYAKEYKHLFTFIFEEKYVKSKEEDEFNEQIVKKIMEAGDYTLSDALMFFNQSWVFAYGIACGIVHGYMMFSDEEIDKLLNNQFLALKQFFRR